MQRTAARPTAPNTSVHAALASLAGRFADTPALRFASLRGVVNAWNVRRHALLAVARMKRWWRMKMACVPLLLLLGGCGLLDHTVQRPGLLGDSGIPPEIELPDTFVVGAPALVSVSTLGSGSCTRVARTDVSVSGSLATGTPVDEYRTEGACTADLRRFVHTAPVRFQSAGPASVRVVGRFGYPERDTVIVRSTIVRSSS